MSCVVAGFLCVRAAFLDTIEIIIVMPKYVAFGKRKVNKREYELQLPAELEEKQRTIIDLELHNKNAEKILNIVNFHTVNDRMQVLYNLYDGLRFGYSRRNENLFHKIVREDLAPHFYFIPSLVPGQNSAKGWLLQQQLYSRLFSYVYTQLKSIEVIDAVKDTIRVYSMMRLQIFKDTLEHLYPDCCVNGRVVTSLEWILGRSLHVHVVKTYYFSSSCISRIDMEMAFLPAWIELLANVTLAHRIVSTSAISSNGHIHLSADKLVSLSLPNM